MGSCHASDRPAEGLGRKLNECDAPVSLLARSMSTRDRSPPFPPYGKRLGSKENVLEPVPEEMLGIYGFGVGCALLSAPATPVEPPARRRKAASTSPLYRLTGQVRAR